MRSGKAWSQVMNGLSTCADKSLIVTGRQETSPSLTFNWYLSAPPSERAVKEVSAIYRTKGNRLVAGKSSIVAGKSFQKTPLYGLFASRHGLKVIIFNDIGTACKWLGIDPKEAEQMVEVLRTRMRGETSGRGESALRS